MTRKFKTGGESEFEALQFHVHAPSENTINGQHMDLEIHFVHQYVGGGLGGVLSVMFDTEVGGDAENLFINQLINGAWPSDGNKVSNRAVFVDGFLTNSIDTDEFWSFDGSLTTPPCTEGIKWTVLKKVQSISPSQLARFTSQWAGDLTFAGGNGNNRAVQPRNGRDVYQRGEVRRSSKAWIIVLSVLLGIFAASCLLMICPLATQSAILSLICCFGIFRIVKGFYDNKISQNTVAAQASRENASLADKVIKKTNEME